MNYVLDACALLAVIKRERGWKKVAALIIRAKAGDIRISMHLVTVLEVYYSIWREQGREAAQDILDRVDDSAIRIITTITKPFFREAGWLKAMYRMSLADTFVCAAAVLSFATVVTADGEMQPIEGIKFFFFRPPKPKD